MREAEHKTNRDNLNGFIRISLIHQLCSFDVNKKNGKIKGLFNGDTQ